jgi:protein TonB
MPADMFRLAPPARRRASLIPVSIAAHAVALSALVIAPILADGDLPEPARAVPIYVEVTLPTLPPSPPRQAAPPKVSTTSRPSNLAAAPLIAPDHIGPETTQTTTEVGSEAEGFLPGGPGVPTGEIVNYIPPPPPPHKPLRVGGEVRAPRKLRDVAPKYPVIAQQARIEGTVVIDAVIGVDGRVAEMRVTQSVPFLDQAARDAVSQWVFTPTRLNGEPVPVVMTVTVEFKLR